MKILILGAAGQLGHDLARNFRIASLGDVLLATRDGTDVEGVPTHAVDMSRFEDLRALLDQAAPDLIINAAAYTAVDRAEEEEGLATRVNGEALAVIGQWAATRQALVVHYSTDYVFDGTSSTPYSVDDVPHPVNAYGRSKLAGERALVASGAQHFLFRTAWVYAAHGRNFFKTMLRLAAEKESLSIVDDQFGSPTTTTLIAEASAFAIEQWHRFGQRHAADTKGTYHLVSSGVTTWHDFAVEIFRKAKEAGLLKAVPAVARVSSKDYPTLASRPKWSVLDNSNFAQRFGFPLPDWQAGLDSIINQLSAEANGLPC